MVLLLKSVLSRLQNKNRTIKKYLQICLEVFFLFLLARFADGPALFAEVGDFAFQLLAVRSQELHPVFLLVGLGGFGFDGFGGFSGFSGFGTFVAIIATYGASLIADTR